MSFRLKIIVFVILCLIGIVSHYLLGDNNIVEEIAEDAIKKEYGINIEFSGEEK